MSLELAWDIIKFMFGVIVGGTAGYLLLAQKVSFIMGQLTHMGKIFETIEKNQKLLGTLEALTKKQKADLNHYYDRLKKVEKAIFAEDDDDLPPISQM